MKYKVIKDFKGSPDGIQVCSFSVGDEFNHEGDLLKVALENDWVEDVANPKKPAKPRQTKEEKAAAEAAEAKKLAIANAETALANAKTALEGADDAGKEAAEKAVEDAQKALDALTAE